MVTAKGSGDVSFASNLTAILLGGFVKAIEVTNKVIPYVPQNRAWGTKSVHRTRSRRMKFCVQRGLGALPPTSKFVAVDSHKHCLLQFALLKNVELENYALTAVYRCNYVDKGLRFILIYDKMILTNGGCIS